MRKHPALNWSAIHLVVFDVDGTLYAPKHIRRKMIFLLLLDALKTFSLQKIRLIRDYRKLREQAGEENNPAFESHILEKLSKKFRMSPEAIDAIIHQWMHITPLPFLLNARYHNIDKIFERLKQAQKQIGILSDYPASEKISAMKLSADLIYWAGSKEIMALKPNPAGLNKIIEKAGVLPSQTLMIGDRDDRDGEIARRAGAHFLLYGKSPSPEIHSFQNWADLLNSLEEQARNKSKP